MTVIVRYLQAEFLKFRFNIFLYFLPFTIGIFLIFNSSMVYDNLMRMYSEWAESRLNNEFKLFFFWHFLTTTQHIMALLIFIGVLNVFRVENARVLDYVPFKYNKLLLAKIIVVFIGLVGISAIAGSTIAYLWDLYSKEMTIMPYVNMQEVFLISLHLLITSMVYASICILIALFSERALYLFFFISLLPFSGTIYLLPGSVFHSQLFLEKKAFLAFPVEYLILVGTILLSSIYFLRLKNLLNHDIKFAKT